MHSYRITDPGKPSHHPLWTALRRTTPRLGHWPVRVKPPVLMLGSRRGTAWMAHVLQLEAEPGQLAFQARPRLGPQRLGRRQLVVIPAWERRPGSQ